jgi:predicted lipid carrier protein YhbT/chorismate mutase
VDDAMIVLLAARRKLVSALGPVKRAAQAPVRDPAREEQVHERARRLAARLRVPPASADNLIGALVADACFQQSSRASHGGVGADTSRMRLQHTLLRLIPPPRYWRAPLALTPPSLRDAFAERVLSKALGGSLKDDAMTAIAERRLGIEVTDLGLAWVLEVRDGALRRTQGVAEAVVHGTATDLLLLSSRLEDADTLFFQRRLKLTGDVELGLTVRNLLDRMPWETLPLGVRIALHRTSRLLRAARDATHAAHPSGEYR